MSLFIIENAQRGSNVRRIAFVYANDEDAAKQKLMERFPSAYDIRFIRPDQIIQTYSTCIIK